MNKTLNRQIDCFAVFFLENALVKKGKMCYEFLLDAYYDHRRDNKDSRLDST